MRLGKNIWWAIGIFGVITAWLAYGSLFGSHGPEPEAKAKPPAAAGKTAGKTAEQKPAAPPAANRKGKPGQKAAAADPDKTFRVRARKMKAEPRAAELVVRGRTEAVRSVAVKAETAGAVSKLAVEKGAHVKEGDLICELEPAARQAQLAQSRAMLKQTELEYQAAAQLAKKGYRSETQVAAAQASLDAARAAMRQSEIELERTRIRAPFDGIVDDRMVEVGDYLQVGGACAQVVDLDPILVVGPVSERDVSLLTIGADGHARLVDGTDFQGKLRFVGMSADPATRTFRVELEAPNPDGKLRDGITADIRVPVQAVLAHKVSSAILGLNDNGVLGVRTVETGNIVKFNPVQIIADDGDGVWIAGLSPESTIITVGQEFVVPGEKVEVALENDGAKS